MAGFPEPSESNLSLFRHLADNKQLNVPDINAYRKLRQQQTAHITEENALNKAVANALAGGGANAMAGGGETEVASRLPGAEMRIADPEMHAPKSSPIGPIGPIGGRLPEARVPEVPVPEVPGVLPSALRAPSVLPGGPLGVLDHQESFAGGESTRTVQPDMSTFDMPPVTARSVAQVASWGTERGAARGVDAAIDLEKHGFLNELQELEAKGYRLTRSFSMEDSLETIQFECDRIRSNEDTMRTVKIMGVFMQCIIAVVSFGNAKFGPVLRLGSGRNSWMMQEMTRIRDKEYNGVLERLYRKHWRKGSMSPEMELMMMLGGSACMYHVTTVAVETGLPFVKETVAHVMDTQGLLARPVTGAGSTETQPSGPVKPSGGAAPFDIAGVIGSALGGGGGVSGLLSTLLGGVGGGGGNRGVAQPAQQSRVRTHGRQDNEATRARDATRNVMDGPQGPQAEEDFAFVSSHAAAAPPRTHARPSMHTSPPRDTASRVAEDKASRVADMQDTLLRKQTEMLERMDRAARMAEEQVRASQARQVEFEAHQARTMERLERTKPTPSTISVPPAALPVPVESVAVAVDQSVEEITSMFKEVDLGDGRKGRRARSKAPVSPAAAIEQVGLRTDTGEVSIVM